MRKILMSMMSAVALFATAGIQYPALAWQSDLQEQYNLNKGMLGLPWITYGTGAKPSLTWSTLFPNYEEGPYYELVTLAGDVLALSCSSFTPSSQADAWLVTPEFEVTSDNMLLSYTICAQGSSTPAPYKVLVSENGPEKEAFTDTIVASTFKGSEDGIKTSQRFVPFKGYGGKKIRLAFINQGQDCGVLGFSKIDMRPYSASVDNLTPQFVEPGTEVSVRFSVTLATPETIGGFKARLETSDGQVQTYSSTKSYSTTSTTQKFSFPEKIRVEDSQCVTYTMTITLNKDGYDPIVVTGSIAGGYPAYPATVLLEEFTGTWCGYCPRGAAALEYYHNTYNGEDGGPKVLGVAVHSGDAMQVTYNSYYNELDNLSIAPSQLPNAIYNRLFCADPASQETLESLLDTEGYAKVEITGLDADLDEMKGKITFETSLAMDMESPEINASVILTENNVHVFDADYFQTNYYSGMSYGDIEEQYGSDMAPYFEPYINGGSILVDMTYNDVARGCWPSVAGLPVGEGTWKAGESKKAELDFEIPFTVMDYENMDFTVVLTDGLNGQVISADRVSYVDAPSAVGRIQTNSDIAVKCCDGIISIGNAAGCTVRILSIDGRVLKSVRIATDGASIDVSSISGPVLISVTGDKKSVCRKAIL